MSTEKVYIKVSSIPEYGKGLFSNTFIKKGEQIAEFKGKLLKPGQSPSNDRSNIYFNDEYIIECYPDNPASFANDAINFDRKRRQMMASLKSSEPFYKTHPNVVVNAEIEINDKTHKAYLMALIDIQPETEVFCHYGFTYWFMKELTEVGYLYEHEIEKMGFPSEIWKYPAFKNYLMRFYPNMINFSVMRYNEDSHDVIVRMKDDTFVVINIKEFAHKISCVQVNQI